MDIGQLGNTSRASTRVDQSTPVAATGIAKTTVEERAAVVMTASAVKQPNQAVSESQVGQALQSINKALQKLSSNLEFTIDEDSNRTIVKVMDNQTKEVIRQMPSVEAVEISKALDKLQGLLVKQKA